MNTAKNFQLLDDNNNNISPITNIESLYYEVNEGGVIYRNALYQHFPVYVKYNNNIDDPIDAGSLKAYIDNNIYNTTDSSFYKSPNVQLKEQSTPSTPGADILVTAIRQSRLANTRYHKLDISTYNLTSILNLYAPKQYVVDAITTLTGKTDNIKYKSNIIKNNGSGQFKTLYDIGSYPKGTSIGELNDKAINDIIDNAFFKETAPSIIDAGINLLNKTPIYINIDPTNINTIHDVSSWRQSIYDTVKNFITTNYTANDSKFVLTYKSPGQGDTISANTYFNVKIDKDDVKLKNDILTNNADITSSMQYIYADLIPLKITATTNWVDSNYTPYVKTSWGKEVSKELSYNIIKNTPINVIEPLTEETDNTKYVNKTIYMQNLPPVSDAVNIYSNTVYLKQKIAKRYTAAYISYPRQKSINSQYNIFESNNISKDVFDALWNNVSTHKFNITTETPECNVNITHKFTNILALIIPVPNRNIPLDNLIKITHVIDHDCKIPIIENNQFYEWTKIISINGVEDYKILLLDTMLADNTELTLNIKTNALM